MLTYRVMGFSILSSDINLSKVTSLQANRIMLGKIEVPLGGSHKHEFLKILGV